MQNTLLIHIIIILRSYYISLVDFWKTCYETLESCTTLLMRGKHEQLLSYNVHNHLLHLGIVKFGAINRLMKEQKKVGCIAICTSCHHWLVPLFLSCFVIFSSLFCITFMLRSLVPQRKAVSSALRTARCDMRCDIAASLPPTASWETKTNLCLRR